MRKVVAAVSFLSLFLGGFIPPGWVSAFPYLTGWPRTFNAYHIWSPVIADLDGDGKMEVLLTTFDPLMIQVLNHRGIDYNVAWPKVLDFNVGSPPSVADLDGDKNLEIIVGADYLYAWHHYGGLVVGFPSTYMGGDYMVAAPAIGDLNNDGFPEITGGSFNNDFYVWDGQGTVLPGFPMQFISPIHYSPAIGDLDQDGLNEVVAPCNGSHLFAYNYDGSLVNGIWDMTSSYFGYCFSDITLGDVDGDNLLEVMFIGYHDPMVWYPMIINNDTTLTTGWPSQGFNPTT